MIEAVNAVVANASALRASTEAVSAARVVSDLVATVEVGETTAQLPKAPYVSPYISIDPNSNKAVLQIRNSDTGDVLDQFPSDVRLEQLKRIQAEQQRIALKEFAKTQQAVIQEPKQQQAKQTSVPSVRTPVQQAEIISVQAAVSKPAANTTPKVAIAAFSAAQASQASASSGVSVFA